MAKSFKDSIRAKQAAENPALQFISQPITAEEPEEKPERITESKAKKPRTATKETTGSARPHPRKELKTRRLQLLLQPSLYDAVKERAEAEGLSINEEIGYLLRDALGM